MQPLVSVITPTWQRHDLLLTRCIPSVRRQLWSTIEHIVVSDGPDPELERKLRGTGVIYSQLAGHVDEPIDYGSRARNNGLGLVSGRYVAYLDDDNAYRPEHILTLVRALRADRLAEFAFSQMLTSKGSVIGGPRPGYGAIDTSLIMHRRGVPERYGMWPLPQEIVGDGHAPDWSVVQSWLRGGARWTWAPRVTVDYYS